MTYKRPFEFKFNFAIAFEISLPVHHYLKMIKKELNMSNYLSNISISIYLINRIFSMHHIYSIILISLITFSFSSFSSTYHHHYPQPSKMKKLSKIQKEMQQPHYIQMQLKVEKANILKGSSPQVLINSLIQEPRLNT